MAKDNKVHFKEDDNYAFPHWGKELRRLNNLYWDRDYRSKLSHEEREELEKNMDKLKPLGQLVEIFSDGTCLFRAETEEEKNRKSDLNKERKSSLVSFDDGNFNGEITSEQRRLFFEANKSLFQKVVDDMNERPRYFIDSVVGDPSSTWREDHKNWLDLEEFGRRFPSELSLWYEGHREHTCGVTPEEMMDFARNSNVKMDDRECEGFLNYLDGSVGEDKAITFLGVSADRKRIFVELYTDYNIDDGSEAVLSGTEPRSFMKFASYDYADFLYFLQKFGSYYTGCEPGVIGKDMLIDTKGDGPAYDFSDIPASLNQVVCGSRTPSEFIPCALGLLSMTPAYSDIMKEFPEGAFQKDEYGFGGVYPNEEHPYWNSEDAKKAVEDLEELLGHYAPKGYEFSRICIHSGIHPTFSYGFWPKDYEYNQQIQKSPAYFNSERLYQWVHAKKFPAFAKQDAVSKDGEVSIHAPNIQDSEREMITGTRYLMALGECVFIDPAKGGGKRDYILQQCESELYMGENFVGLSKFEGDEVVGRYNSMVSLPPVSKGKPPVAAKSDDLIDYLARFQLAARTGRDFVTTEAVMEGARKKLEQFLERELCNGSYSNIYGLGKKIDKKEIEIARAMTEEAASKKKEKSHDKGSVER